MQRVHSDLERTVSEELLRACSDTGTTTTVQTTKTTDTSHAAGSPRKASSQIESDKMGEQSSKRSALLWKAAKKAQLRAKQLCQLLFCVLSLRTMVAFLLFNLVCAFRWILSWLYADEKRGNSFGSFIAKWVTRQLDTIHNTKVPPTAEPRHPPVVCIADKDAEERIAEYCRRNIPVVIDFTGLKHNEEDVKSNGALPYNKTEEGVDSDNTPDETRKNDIFRWSRQYFMQSYGSDLMPMTKPSGETVKRPLRSLADTEEQYYIKGSDTLFAAHPELKRTAKKFLAPFAKIFQQRVMGMQMFMSQDTSNNGLGFHCANRRNLVLQLEGEKTWTLVAPTETHLMYPVFLRSHVVVYSNVQHAHTVHERIDQVPLYKHAQKWRCRLRPGQGLINPAWWWHSIENHGGSLAIATRWGHGLTGLNNLFEFMQLTSVPILKDSLMSAYDREFVKDENELTPQEKRTAFSACSRQLYW